MSINQNIRYENPNSANYNNPESFYDIIKPARIITGLIAPSILIGENEWYYIDSSSGNFYKKINGQWTVIYNFSTGGGGGIDGALNVGTGVGIFTTVFNNKIQLRSITPIYPVSISTDIDNINLSIAPNSFIDNCSQIGVGAQVCAGKESSNLVFKSLVGSPTILLTETQETITFSTTALSEGITSGSNVGTGQGLFKQVLLQDMEFKSILGSSDILIASNANELIITPRIKSWARFGTNLTIDQINIRENTPTRLEVGSYPIADAINWGQEVIGGIDSGIAYFYYTKPDFKNFVINLSMSAQLSPCPVNEITITAALIDIGNNVQETSTCFMSFGNGVDTFKTGSLSNTFLFTPIVNTRYCIRFTINNPNPILFNINWRFVNIIIEELNR